MVGRFWPILAISAVLAVPASAQEDLERGKTPAQIFAADCTMCHRTPQGLAKSSSVGSLTSFLRQHYTPSIETARTLATYLTSLDGGRATDRKPVRAEPGEEPARRKKTPATTATEPAPGAEDKPAATTRKKREATPSTAEDTNEPAADKPKPAARKKQDAKPDTSETGEAQPAAAAPSGGDQPQAAAARPKKPAAKKPPTAPASDQPAFSSPTP